MKIGSLNATDLDGDALEFGWTSSTSSAIAIDPLSGELFLDDAQALDYERLQLIELEAFVRDGADATASHRVPVRVEIAVLNANDHAPEFEQSLYRFEWFEGSPMEFQVHADDLDAEPWNELRYSLAPASQAESIFDVDALSGRLLLTVPEDRVSFEEESAFSFAVAVRDAGAKSDRAFVHVQLRDLNNHAPQFERELYQVRILLLPSSNHIAELLVPLRGCP